MPRTMSGLKKRGKIFYAYFRLGGRGGRIVEKTTGQTNYHEARIELDRIRKEHEDQYRAGQTVGTAPRISTAKKEAHQDALTKMAAWDLNRAESAGSRGQGRHAGTIGQIQYCWRYLCKHLRGVRDLSRAGLQNYVTLRRGDTSPRSPQGPSNKTIKAEMICLKRAMLALDDQLRLPTIKDRDWPKLEHLPRDKCDKVSGHYLEPSDCRRFVEELKSSASGREHGALFLIHLLTGIRKTEAARISESMVVRRERYDNMWVLELPAKATKTGTERAVPLVPVALKAVRVLIAQPRIKEHRTAFDVAARKAGMSRAPSLRDCRTTFITTCTEAGHDHPATLYLAGHFTERADSNARYQKPTPSRLVAAARATAAALGFASSEVTEGVTEGVFP